MTQGYTMQGMLNSRAFPARRNVWSRPADWLPITTPGPTDEKIVLLHAVQSSGGIANYFSVTISGAYQIDYGDGNAPVTYSSGSKASKELNWSAYSSSTLTSQGFRQAIITITPQSGSNLTSINFDSRHASAGSAYPTGILDVDMAAPLCSSFSFRSQYVAHRQLRRFNWAGSNMVTNFITMFAYCSSLISVPALDTSSGTSFTSMFQSCSSLISVPALDTSSGTSFTSMFSACSSLTSAPLQGTRYSISYATCQIQAADLDAIYTGLGTAVGSQTITVSNNPGTTADNPSIATAKGWTVAGS